MIQSIGYAMDIGEQMLLCGAEVHRVEESISRMCDAFGAVRADVFIITSSMVVTVYFKDGNSYTQTRRVSGTDINYEKLHHLNRLCRDICEKKISVEEIEERLNQAACSKRFPVWLEAICYALIAGAFCLFFGGGLVEMAISFLVGLIVRVVVFLCDWIIPNKIFGKFISSAVSACLAFLFVRLGVIGVADKVIIGNIMTLIPGIGLTNALRDLFVGDSIAGLLRCVEAMLTALAIAAGYFLVAVLGGFAL